MNSSSPHTSSASISNPSLLVGVFLFCHCKTRPEPFYDYFYETAPIHLFYAWQIKEIVIKRKNTSSIQLAYLQYATGAELFFARAALLLWLFQATRLERSINSLNCSSYLPFLRWL
jgi:hypothetical protein